jgi:phage-related minor tail protein
MELSELKFVVDTKQLEDAATKIKELAVEVSKLNKPMQALNKETAQSAKELSKAKEAAAKAALAQSKLEQAQSKGTQAASKSISVLERQNLILEYMAQGNSKGQASILATAKAAGALDADMLSLNQTLKTQRTLIGGDPFDKSIGLMQKLQNEYKTTLEVTTLFNRNLGLTEKQMVDLAREKERLIALYGIEGKDIKQLAGEYDNLIRRSVEINRTNSQRTNSMRDQVKAQTEAAKATAYLAAETDRVNRLTETNGNITIATNNKLIKFEQALKLSGQTAAEQTAALEKYKASLLSIQKASGNRQIDYLSRALGPQITDIGVGLATGQSPLTILLQQGGQLRDQFALAGVAGSEMGKMLVQASKAMVVSIKDIGLAVGQLVTGAIAGTGKAIIGGIVAPFKRLSEARESLRQLDEGMISNLRYARLMEVANGRLIQSFISFGKVAGVVALVAAGMLAKGLYDVIKQQDALTTQLVLTGASLGVNTTQATSYANSLNAVGVTTNSALKVIAAMAKEGGFLANEITMVVTAANNLKFAGVAIEDTVKQFAKLKEKPVEALIEIAKATGLVKPEIVALVSELEMQGKTSQAAAIAMKAYADVTVQQKDRLKEELSGFAVFMKTLSSSVGEFFDEVFRGLWRKASPTEAIKREIKDLENTIKLGTQASDKTKAENNAKLTSLKEQLQLSQRAADAELTRSSDNIRAAKALGEWQKLSITNLDDQKKAEKDIENIRKVGLEAKKSEAEIEKLIADYKEKNKKAKPAKTDQEKEDLRLLKESEKYLSRVATLTNTATKEQEGYTKAQKLALDIFSDPDFKNYPEAQRIKIANAIELAHNEELVANELTKQRAIQKQIYDEAVKQQDAKDKLGIAAFDNSVTLNKAVKEESDELIFQATLIGKTDEQRKKAIKTRQSELTLAKELKDIEDSGELGFGVTKESLREAANQRFLERAKNINTEIAIDAATKTLEEYNKIADGITDSIVTALIDGGEEGGKKLRAIIEAELRKPLTVLVKATVDILSSGINSAIGGKAGSTLGSTIGGAVGNYFSTSALGATLFGNSAAYGAAIGTTSVGAGSQAAMLAAQTGEFGAAGLSATAGSGGFGASMVAAGPYVLAALAVANALGLFRSTKQVGGGISGTLGGSVDQYGLMRKSGTLFNGPSYFRQNQGTFAGNDLLQTSFQQLKDSTKAMADTLKLSSAGVEDFTKTIDISFDGLTNTQIEEKIASTLKSVNDELAALVLGAGATADQLNTLYNNVMQQRYDLETQLLELQGKTLELRERERAKIYDVNKEMFDQIKALEDQKVANEQAAAAMEKLTSVTTTIVDEINRLRGVSTSSSGLEAQFAILTAQARSGDLAALAQLPDVTKGLEQIAASSAVNATDIIVARARLAQSLQDTLGYFPSGTSLSTSSTSVSASNALSSGLTVSSGTSVNSASSNQELLAALVTEVQGLRAEVRADVSHNAKTAKILERVNQDGESLSITTLV